MTKRLMYFSAVGVHIKCDEEDIEAEDLINLNDSWPGSPSSFSSDVSYVPSSSSPRKRSKKNTHFKKMNKSMDNQFSPISPQPIG